MILAIASDSPNLGVREQFFTTDRDTADAE
jgi:hypothetical protein